MNDLSGLDLDWFFATKEGKIIHVASAGGDVPANVDEKYLDEIDDIIYELEEKYDYIVNPNLKEILSKNNRNPPKMKYYLETFINMAKLGIYSFDKSDINNDNDNNYHFVAGPKDGSSSVEDIEGLKDVMLTSYNKTLIEPFSTFNLDDLKLKSKSEIDTRNRYL